jgi:nickel-dependent lactate racemase
MSEKRMKIPIWYVNQDIELRLPDSCQVDVYDLPQKRLTRLSDDHWLHSGIVPAEVSEFLSSAQDLLVVVNDHYRPTPTASILSAIGNALPLEKTTFLVATGLHGAPSEMQLQKMFGKLYLQTRERLKIHNAYDDSQLVTFGSGAKTVGLNRLFEQCDSALIIGSVEPHYFAGFTGGRKIILPGCASFADVSRNHAHALCPQSQPLARRGNPVWEDIYNRTSCLDYKRRYAIQVVCDHQGSIFHLSHGDWDRAYDSACDFVGIHYAHNVAVLYDVVVSVVCPPLDLNLYQLQKSYENVAAAVKPGGTVLLISGCIEGTGDGRFLKLAEKAAAGDLYLDGQSEWMLMGIHKIRRTEKLTERLKLMLVSTLPASDLEFLPIQPWSDIDAAVAELIKIYGMNCNIAVVLDSASQVLSCA